MRGEKKLGSKLLSFIFLLELISVEDKNPYISEKKNLLIKFNVYVILVFLINDTARQPLTLIYAVTVQSKLDKAKNIQLCFLLLISICLLICFHNKMCCSADVLYDCFS